MFESREPYLCTLRNTDGVYNKLSMNKYGGNGEDVNSGNGMSCLRNPVEKHIVSIT